MNLRLRVIDKETSRIYDVKAIDFLHECVYISTDTNEHWQDKLGNYEILFNTGLLDKKGKEIQEGDVVAIFDDSYTMVVTYNRARAQFEPREIVNPEHVEIIGNIYTHPKLQRGVLKDDPATAKS